MQRTGTISPMWLCQHNKWYCEKCTLTVLMDPIPHQHEYRQNHPSSKHCDKPYTGSCSPWKRLPLMALLVHPTVAVTLSLLLWNKVLIVYVYVVVEVAVSSFLLISHRFSFTVSFRCATNLVVLCWKVNCLGLSCTDTTKLWVISHRRTHNLCDVDLIFSWIILDNVKNNNHNNASNRQRYTW